MPEALFVKISEQMEWLNADASTVQAALPKTPEVLHRVCVNIAINILDSVVDDGVFVFVILPVIGLQFVTEDSGTSFNALPDGCLQFLLGPRVHVSSDSPPR
jgi:hypothetical protein